MNPAITMEMKNIRERIEQNIAIEHIGLIKEVATRVTYLESYIESAKKRYAFEVADKDGRENLAYAAQSINYELSVLMARVAELNQRIDRERGRLDGVREVITMAEFAEADIARDLAAQTDTKLKGGFAKQRPAIKLKRNETFEMTETEMRKQADYYYSREMGGK